MAIGKSQGTTPTERWLANLAERTFLKAWSYPNPFKDDGKELCDLLAVFENHILIFFDREGRQFDNSDADPAINWTRWKRGVVDAQINTANGAERYVRAGRSIFLDAKLEVPFPLSVDPKKMIVHKIIVAHGATEACKQFSSENMSGSLAIAYSDHSADTQSPFFVELERTNPIHVLDTHTLPIVLGELDTFADLTWYLDEKRRAISALALLSYAGEEDLLAHYIWNMDNKTKRHFIDTRDKSVNAVMIGEGEWNGLIQRPEYKRKKVADTSSYLWDEIIQRTCQNALDGTLQGTADVLRGRSAIHEMAKEPRFFRRALADNMIAAIREFPESPGAITRKMSFMPSFYSDRAYIFLQVNVSRDIRGAEDFETEYRPKRRKMLEIACGAAKNEHPNLRTIIGIVIDAPKFSKQAAEDFILMDCNDWPPERERHYQEANEPFRFFKTKTLTREERVTREFPNVARKADRKVRQRSKAVNPNRNGLCSCGSGKLHRKCHGRRT